MAQKIISYIKVKPIKYGHLEGGKLYLMVFASNAKYQSIVSKETKSYFDGIDLEVAEKSGLISFREVIDIQEVTIEPIPGIIF